MGGVTFGRDYGTRMQVGLGIGCVVSPRDGVVWKNNVPSCFAEICYT